MNGPNGSTRPPRLPITPAMGRVGTLTSRYLKHQQSTGRLSPVTVAHRRRVLRTFADSVGDTPLERLDHRHVDRWLGARGRALGTRRQYLTCVRSFSRWCVRQRIIRHDFTANVDMPPLPRRLPKALTAEQVAAVLAATEDSRDTLMLLLMVQEGLRVGEVARLQVGDIDAARRHVHVRGKGGHERRLPISDETWAALVVYLGVGWSAGALLRSQLEPSAGLVPHTITLRTSDLMRTAGVPGSAHSLRHTAASDVIENGADIIEVRDMLGHVVDRYHADLPSQRDRQSAACSDGGSHLWREKASVTTSKMDTCRHCGDAIEPTPADIENRPAWRHVAAEDGLPYWRCESAGTTDNPGIKYHFAEPSGDVRARSKA